MESEQQFVTLAFDERYEISTTEPWNIRRIGKPNCLKQNLSGGYLGLSISYSGTQYIHRLVALQFVPNDDPENKTYINHKNGNKRDNSISNLEWCTQSYNLSNRSKFKLQEAEFLEKMPNDAIEISSIDDYELRDYFFDCENERIIKIQRYKIITKFKVIKPTLSNKNLYVTLKDVNGRNLGRSYNKLIRDLKEACD